MEIWKTVDDTNNMIEISNMGRVRSWLRGTPYILKCQKDSKGYLRVRITINRQKMSHKIHRLVAKAFIENPNDLPQVNHKDGDKSNNCVENLEWISNKDNSTHAINNGLWENVFKASKKNNDSRKMPVIAMNGQKRLKFESISEAEKFFGSRHICEVLKGKRKHVKGWTFICESEVM